jgi:ribosomal protein L35AE/L33A
MEEKIYNLEFKMTARTADHHKQLLNIIYFSTYEKAEEYICDMLKYQDWEFNIEKFYNRNLNYRGE